MQNDTDVRRNADNRGGIPVGNIFLAALGGAVGGYASFMIAVMTLFPSMFPAAWGGHFCGPSIGVVTGILPGIVASFSKKGYAAKVASFFVACIFGALFTALVVGAAAGGVDC